MRFNLVGFNTQTYPFMSGTNFHHADYVANNKLCTIMQTPGNYGLQNSQVSSFLYQVFVKFHGDCACKKNFI